MQDWKKIFSSSQLTSASMVMGILNDNDIPAKTLNKIKPIGILSYKIVT